MSKGKKKRRQREEAFLDFLEGGQMMAGMPSMPPAWFHQVIGADPGWKSLHLACEACRTEELLYTVTHWAVLQFHDGRSDIIGVGSIPGIGMGALEGEHFGGYVSPGQDVDEVREQALLWRQNRRGGPHR